MPPFASRSRSSAVKKLCLPSPFWFRIHASKPAEWVIEKPDWITAVRFDAASRSSSFLTSAICFRMFMPPFLPRAAPWPDSADGPDSERSKVPSPNFWANCRSAPPSASAFVRSYTARRCRSDSVSYAFWICAQSGALPPRSGWCFIAFSL